MLDTNCREYPFYAVERMETGGPSKCQEPPELPTRDLQVSAFLRGHAITVRPTDRGSSRAFSRLP